MYIDENQSVAIMWNGKPIGKLFCNFTHPIDGITTMGWRGTCLGEEIMDGGLENAEMKAIRIALRHGLKDITEVNGEGIDRLYMPAFED